MDDATRQARHEARLAAIADAVRRVARECGVTPTVVRVLWWHAGLDGQAVTYPVGGPFTRRNERPPNLHRAIKAGAVEDGERDLVERWVVQVHRLTPLGRRIVWRIQELLKGDARV